MKRRRQLSKKGAVTESLGSLLGELRQKKGGRVSFAGYKEGEAVGVGDY